MSIIVKAGPNDNTDAVIRKFQKRVALENVVQEYRDRQFHKTDSEKRQERRAERQRKINRYRRQSAA
jgi:ribosomal protein S21